jgi:hypothetical protein
MLQRQNLGLDLEKNLRKQPKHGSSVQSFTRKYHIFELQKVTDLKQTIFLNAVSISKKKNPIPYPNY